MGGPGLQQLPWSQSFDGGGARGINTSLFFNNPVKVNLVADREREQSLYSTRVAIEQGNSE
jgi:hypothetical protein